MIKINPIQKLNFVSLTLMLLVLISACASNPADHFTENFYQFLSDDGTEHFTFIIQLKGMQDRNSRVDYINTDNPSRSQKDRNIPQENNQNLDAAFQPDDPNDNNVSLKFRMEEIAYKKLQTHLDARNYCQKGTQIESEDFLDYRYKIKGVCVK